MNRADIVIVGAGIIGLDVALCLAEKGWGQSILIVAEHVPGDTSINYSSPWAGANFSAISGSNANALRWDKLGYLRLMQLAEDFGEDAKIQKNQSFEYWDEHPSQDKIDSMGTYLENFHILPSRASPSDAKFGVSFTTVNINAPLHLQWLRRRLEKTYRIQFLRRRLEHLKDAFTLFDAKIVFNCTGNAARSLPDVADERCYPTRGQILLARAPHIKTNAMRHGKDYETYIIPRPSSNGNVILGGYMQKNVNTGDTFEFESESIYQRTTELFPNLKNPGLEILASFSGLRPSREGGARVEKEVTDQGIIVHNYGAGGTGFQAGLGMAHDALSLVEEELERIEQRPSQSRL